MGHKPWDRAWRRAGKARERKAARTEMLDDMYDIVEAEQRMAADDGHHITLDDLASELGLPR